MTNTYAINTTRGKEFEVEADLKAMGANPWVPRQLAVKHIKERKGPVWFDRPYVGKLIFAVFPAVIFRDVFNHKHVVGKPIPLTDRDINGTPEQWVKSRDGSDLHVPEVYGLRAFKSLVEAEYEDMQKRRENAEWVCAYEPGDAVRILEGPFENFYATFKGVRRDHRDDTPEVLVEVEVFGRPTKLQLAPNYVEVA